MPVRTPASPPDVDIRQITSPRPHRRATRPERAWSTALRGRDRAVGTAMLALASLIASSSAIAATAATEPPTDSHGDAASSSIELGFDHDINHDINHDIDQDHDLNTGSDGLSPVEVEELLDDLLSDPLHDGPEESAELVAMVSDEQGRPRTITIDPDVLNPADTGGSVEQLVGEDTILSIEWDETWELFDDPDRHRQWALNAVSFESVWAQSTGAGTTVAVIDSGIAPHPDLAGRIVGGYDFIAATALTPSTTRDLSGHGTHVAGIIAATARNGIGIHGAAPGVSLMPLRVVSQDRSAKWSDIAAAIRFATDHGASVINLSLGGPNQSETVRAALDDAAARGVVIVAAAGNGGSDPTPIYPAAFASTIGVGAVDQNLARASFSTSGSWVEVVAPGASVLSTSAHGGLELRSGTSMAAPHVSALAAILNSAGSNARGPQIRSAITRGAIDLAAPGWDPHTGHGIIDPARSLSWLNVTTQIPNPATSALRVLDTRSSQPLVANSTLRIPVSSTRTSNGTVVLNVTAVHPSAAGFVTVWDCSGPPVTSNLNFAADDTRANLVITGTDADGSVCVKTSASTDVVVDVVNTDGFGEDFLPITPTRVLDTRLTSRVGADTSVAVDLSSYLPGGDRAVVANVTSVHPASAGYLSVFPCGAQPTTSTLNFAADQTTAATTIVGTASSRICVHTSATADILVDITGSFSTRTIAHSPVRALDTRNSGIIAAGERIEVPISSSTGLGLTEAITATVTAVEPMAAGFVTVWDCGAEPETSNLNFAAFATVANAVISRVSADQRLCLRPSTATHLLVDLTARSAPAGG